VIAIHFLDLAIDGAEGFLLLLEMTLGFLQDEPDDTERQGQDEEGGKRHLPADGEHHVADADDHDDGSDELGDALGEALVDRVDVIGDVGEDFAVVVRIEILDGKAVDFILDVFAHFVGDVIGDFGHDETLDIVERGADPIQDQHFADDPADGREINVAGSSDPFHQTFDQQRRGLAKDFRTDDRKDRRSNGKQKNESDFDGIRFEPF
jgi:hypothetical protein